MGSKHCILLNRSFGFFFLQNTVVFQLFYFIHKKKWWPLKFSFLPLIKIQHRNAYASKSPLNTGYWNLHSQHPSFESKMRILSVLNAYAFSQFFLFACVLTPNSIFELSNLSSWKFNWAVTGTCWENDGFWLQLYLKGLLSPSHSNHTKQLLVSML